MSKSSSNTYIYSISPSSKSNKKLNVILDIDETFIYFIKKRFLDHSWNKLSDSEKKKYNYVESSKGDIIILRPHINKFFDWLFKNCTVSLWTWSDYDYAEWIMDAFILKNNPTRKILYILAEDDASNSSKKHDNSKDLNYLWYRGDDRSKSAPGLSECNTILIDDLPGNSLNTSNRKNSITVNPFGIFGEVKDRSDPYHDLSKDKTLLKIIKFLTKILKNMEENCYHVDDRLENIFSENNIKKYKIQRYVKDLKFKKDIVKAIGIGM